MRHRVISRSAVLALATLLGMTSGTSARASDSEQDIKLLLSVSRADDRNMVVLNCPPQANDTHPRAMEACAALKAAGGDPDALGQKDGACVLMFDPVTVEVRGRYNDGTIQWSRTFGNDCLMRSATGPVFDF